jgi:hypothetical protein
MLPCMLPVACMLSYALLDHELRHFDAKTRWFFIHSIVNVVICVCSIPSLFRVVADPYNAMNTAIHAAPSRYPIVMTTTLHLYHMLYFTMRRHDLFHHIAFIPTLGMPNCIYNFGELSNLFCFFICGLPGAITYFLLAMQQCNHLKQFDERTITACLNVWCRCPGILYGTFCGLSAFVYGMHSVPLWAMMLQILMPLNGIYYMQESVIRCAKR